VPTAPATTTDQHLRVPPDGRLPGLVLLAAWRDSLAGVASAQRGDVTRRVDGRLGRVTDDLLLEARPHEGVAVLTLHRPDKKNALSITLRDALAARMTNLSVDEAVSVVVLAGAGGAFSAGFDFEEFAGLADPKHADRLWRSADAFHRVLLDYPLPLVAAVEGVAYAGGFDLAVLCDLRVAGRSARFAHPEVAFGDVMYGPLRELVGGSVARELVLTGRRLGAEEACTLGLVNRVVDDGQALDAGVALAVEVAGAPRPTLLRTIGKIRERAALTLNERVGATLDL